MNLGRVYNSYPSASTGLFLNMRRFRTQPMFFQVDLTFGMLLPCIPGGKHEPLSLSQGVESLPLELQGSASWTLWDSAIGWACLPTSSPFASSQFVGDGEGGGHGAGRKGVFSILALVTPSQVPLFLFAGSYSLDALCYKNNDTDAAGLVSVSYLPIASFVFLFLLFLPLHFCLRQVSLCNSGWPATCCADWAVFELVNIIPAAPLCPAGPL